ncbi:hypothetical protein [Plantibacter sp. YIM 135249]|uniref:hypothetical protein n=1 Tax=Plantibacter sp. YIM 135249 TaxID=3423918 RepID=UPI003D34B068
MSTRKRTPKDFPRMKVRGARRRKIASRQRAAGNFVRSFAGLAGAFRTFGNAAQIAQVALTRLNARASTPSTEEEANDA